MIPMAKYSDYLIFRNNHNEYFDRMSDYSRSLCNYLNKHFIKFYIDNKNLELHYKSVLNEHSCSIFVNDEILVVLKRNNYIDSVSSNVDGNEYITINDWIKGLDKKYKIENWKIHDYRMVTIVGRNMEFTDKNKFSGISPFFACVKSELELLQNSFWNDIMYYEFLAFQEDSERLSIVDRDNNWDIFYDVLLKSMDLSYIDELLELKRNIENIEDKEYSRIKNIIVDSDIYKKTSEIYNKSVDFIKDKEFKSSRQDNMYRIREFLNLTKMKGDSAKTKFSQMLHGLVDRNKCLLLKIVNLINMDGVYKIDE